MTMECSLYLTIRTLALAIFIALKQDLKMIRRFMHLQWLRLHKLPLCFIDDKKSTIYTKKTIICIDLHMWE